MPVSALLNDLDSQAEFALVHSYGGYATNPPVEDLLDGKAWVVLEFEGEARLLGDARLPRVRRPVVRTAVRRRLMTPRILWQRARLADIGWRREEPERWCLTCWSGPGTTPASTSTSS